MNKKTGKILMIIGTALLIAALALIVFNRAEDRAAAENSDGVLENIRSELDAEHISALPLPDELPTVEIDGNEYIGYLTIPALELELPVMASWSYPKLKISPCRYYGELNTGLIIAAHNYECHFGRIKSLQSGDVVLFTDVQGRVYEYAVAETEILQPTAVEDMLSENWDLTLFTCTYGGKSRVTVRCVFSDEY